METDGDIAALAAGRSDAESYANARFIAHAPADVDALLAEVRRLREALVREERLHGDTIDDRDRFHEVADQLAYAVAPEEVIGEHSSMNCPWTNAYELITPKVEVDKLRARVTELEGAAVEARAALAALCYDLEDPGSNAYGALYLLSQATAGADAPKDDTGLALGQLAAQVLHTVADMADPEPPEVSFFGDHGPGVAGWLRMVADKPERVTPAVSRPSV
jgi:hypothetical protein